MTDPFSDNGFDDLSDGRGLRSALALLADDAPEPVTTDVVAAREAWARAHRPVWPVRTARAGWTTLRRAVGEHPLLAVPVAAALAVLLLMAVVAGLPSLHLAAPQPAQTPDGSGALPERVYVAPPWTPSVTDRPIARAGYVVATFEDSNNGDRTTRGFVVSADDGAYRRLPDGAGDALADGHAVLSDDGARLVWWTTPDVVNRPVLTTVHVLDLPTGGLRDVEMPSVFDVSSQVDAVVLDPTGSRAVVRGGDGYDASSFVSTGRVLDLGPVGSRAPVRVGPMCRTCAAPTAWLAGGVLGYDPEAQAPTGLGLPVRAVPADPGPGGGETRSGPGGPDLVVDVTGTTRFAVASQDPNTAGETDQFRLLSRRGAGPVVTTPVGTATAVRPVSVIDTGMIDTGVVVTRLVSLSGIDAPPRQTVELLSTRGAEPMTTVASSASVLAVARDVAQTHAFVPWGAPQFGPSTLGWWSWHVRTPLLVVGGGAGIIAAGWLVGTVLRRSWRRALRRLRPSRNALVLGAAATATAAGLGLLAAPALVTAAMTAHDPHPAADAPTLVPHHVADQRWLPRRAFDTEGAPRTTRLTFALSTTVAGRTGVYGADAGSTRLVRLDDLPGLPWRTAPTQPSFALSPSGRYVALWDDQPQQPVAVVDLREARVVVHPDGLGLLRGSGGATPAVGVADDGALLALAPGPQRSTALWRIPTTGQVTLVAAVPGAASVAVQSGGAVVVSGLISLPGGASETGAVLVRIDGTVAVPEADVDGVPPAPAAQSRNALLVQRPGDQALTVEPLVEAGARTRRSASGEVLGREQAYARGDRVLALQGGPGQEAAAVLRTDEGVQVGLLNPAPATFNGTTLLQRPVLGTVRDGPGGIVVAVDALAGWGGQLWSPPDPWWARTFGRPLDGVGRFLVGALVVLPWVPRVVRRVRLRQGSTRRTPR